MFILIMGYVFTGLLTIIFLITIWQVFCAAVTSNVSLYAHNIGKTVAKNDLLHRSTYEAMNKRVEELEKRGNRKK